jgi:hypothetical protein
MLTAIWGKMENPREADHTDGRSAAANYVATLTANLAEIARQHRLDTLGYILEMARLEAENATKR